MRPADAAFLASREGRKQDARDSFGIIMDELSDVLRPPGKALEVPPLP